MSKIMVVDDEVIVTTQLEERLSLLGYEVVGRASSGETCVETARKLRPDLILMDIVMPGKLDGIDASKAIKRELDIPVIFVTAYSDDQLIGRARETEPYGYILKPFQEKELKAAIEVALYRRNMEQQLRELEERYRLVVDNANDAIVSVDTQGEITFWNRAAENTFGYSAHEIMGKPAALIVPERFHRNLLNLVSRAFSNGKSVAGGKPVEFYGLRKDGSEFPLELSVASWKTQQGVFLTSIIRDITERKRAEEALRKSEQTIRKLAKASIRAHEEERQRAALEVHDRISQTLTAAFYHLQALETIPLRDAVAERLLSRASALVRECIGESRNIMEDLYSPVLSDLGIVVVIDEELHHFQEETGCRTQFHATCPDRLPRDVEVNVYRIFQEALMNIRKHAASAREVAVTLTCKNEVVSLQVVDNGPGFDAEAAMPNKRVGGLKGMQRRAELGGGTFEVESSPGQGTTVTVRLPYTSEPSAADAEKEDKKT